MRVIHELNQLAMGGAERIVLSIAKNDRKNTHIVFSYKDGPMRAVFEKAGIEVLIEKPEGEDPVDMKADLIHIHTGGAPSHLAATVKRQIATVETVHSPVASAVRDEWVSARVGVSDVVTKMNRKCRTIHNGVDIDRLNLPMPEGVEDPKKYYREKFKIPEHAFVVGRLGRLGYDKCIEEWLAAAWYFSKDRPDRDNIYFLICGDEAEENYWATIKVMCASLPLKNVKFIEGCDNVGPVYAAMDVFMYPSPTEGFGLVVMEAMACGAAALVWDGNVNRELLTGHARLVPPTVEGLVSGLELLISQPTIREQIAEEGQALVLSDFTAERMAEKYHRLYDEVYRQEYGMEPPVDAPPAAAEAQGVTA